MSDRMVIIPAVKPDEVEAMRSWVEDCPWQDVDDPAALMDGEIVAGVERNYEGGVRQFLLDHHEGTGA